jgi:hypothetical protein
MKRIKVLAVALVAVFAVGAVASGSAFAAHEIIVKAGGLKLTGKSKAATTDVLETKGGKTVKCTSDTNESELAAATGKIVAKLKVTFKGCTSSFGSECQNTATRGEIQTTELVGETGEITVGSKTGLDFKPKAGALLAKFECEVFGIKEVVEVGKGTGTHGGSVICELGTGLFKTGQKDKLKCEQAAGVQKIVKFVGGAEDALETKVGGGAWEQSGQQNEDEIEQVGGGELEVT